MFSSFIMNFDIYCTSYCIRKSDMLTKFDDIVFRIQKFMRNILSILK